MEEYTYFTANQTAADTQWIKKEIPFPEPSLVLSKSNGFNHSQGARRELNNLVLLLNNKLELKKANVK
jgi:hypothetical protein